MKKYPAGESTKENLKYWSKRAEKNSEIAPRASSEMNLKSTGKMHLHDTGKMKDQDVAS